MIYNPEACLSVPGRLVHGPTQLMPATAPTVALALTPTGPGFVTSGTHMVGYTFIIGGVESLMSPTVSSTSNGSQYFQTNSPLPTPLPAGFTTTRVYMTKAGGSTFYLTSATVGGSINVPDSGLVTVFGGGSLAISGYPYGGTPIGITQLCEVVKDTEFAYAMSETLGIDRAKTYRGATKAALIFTLMQYDPDGYNEVWASSQTSAGGYAGANILMLPQPTRSVQPGLIPPSKPVLFAPDNDQFPAVILYAPAWCDEARQKLALMLNRPLESILVLVSGLDASANDLAIGRLQDLKV